MPTLVNPSSLAKPRGYSNGTLYPNGQLLFVAGQIGWTADAKLVEGGLVPQFDQALRNVLDVVAEAGGTAENIGRLTLYVTDKQAYIQDAKVIGECYRKHMGSHYPAMSLLEVKDLLEDGAMVEIEATAVLS